MHICLGFKQEKLKMKSVIAFLLVSAMTCYAASAAYMPWPHPPREAATLQGRNYQGMPVHQQGYQGKAYWVIIKMLVKIRSTERLYTAPFNIMYLYRALGTFIGGVIFLEKKYFCRVSEAMVSHSSEFHCNTFSLWFYRHLYYIASRICCFSAKK